MDKIGSPNHYDDEKMAGFYTVNLKTCNCLKEDNYASFEQPEVCSTKKNIGLLKGTRECLSFKLNQLKQNYHEEKLKGYRLNSSFHHLRFVVVFLGGLAVGFMSLLRLNITVAILNMVNQTEIYITENPGNDPAKYFGDDYEEVGEFLWDNEIQQTIISYYMIAYTLPQLYTTKLAIKLGVKWSIPLFIGICALSCLLTPIVAYQGWQYVTLLRLLNGLGASAILPVMVYVIEQWMPPCEASLGLTIVQFVQSLLFTTSPLVSGMLAFVHWKWAFYVPAIAALIFCFAWICLVSDNPKESYLISQQELVLIYGWESVMQTNTHQGKFENTSTTESDLAKQETFNATSEVVSVSWTKALQVRSFYALVAVWIFYCSSFGSFSFLLPSYMRQVLQVPIMENGMLCFIIQSGCMISVLWPQPILSLLQRKFHFSLTGSRRVVMAFICSIAIVSWLFVAKYHEYQVVAFSINRFFHLSTDTLVTATIMSQYSKAGISSNVYSVINAIGHFSTVLFCRGAGEFLDISSQSVDCWSWIFIAMCVMNLAIIIIFSTCISSEPISFRKDGSKVGRDVDIEKSSI